MSHWKTPPALLPCDMKTVADVLEITLAKFRNYPISYYLLSAYSLTITELSIVLINRVFVY